MRSSGGGFAGTEQTAQEAAVFLGNEPQRHLLADEVVDRVAVGQCHLACMSCTAGTPALDDSSTFCDSGITPSNGILRMSRMSP